MPNPFQQEFSGMNDPLGFVKKLWGDMQLPGMVTPTVSIDELDKKIQDLKTVESWLTVNMNMVKGTIQALEVQRATIATLKSMGESFAQQMQASHSTESSSDLFKTTSSEDSAASSGHIRPDWPMPESTSRAEYAEEAPIDASHDDELEQDSTSETDSSAGNEQARAAKPAGTSSTTSPASSPFGSPAAWWELLQDQFKQAVSKAMQSDPQQTTSESAKASRKSASSTSSATASTRKAKPATTSTKKKQAQALQLRLRKPQQP